MSWLSSFTHPGRGYDAAQKEMDKYYNEAQSYQMPFMQQGQNAYGGLNSAMQALLNPAALQGEWVNSYQESPSAINAENMARDRGMNAASSMGLLGSSPAINAIQEGTSRIAMDDRQNYLNDLMQKYLAGAGIAGNIYGQGANSAGQMGQNAMNQGQNSAQMAYDKKNAGGNMFGKLIGSAAGMAGGAMSGGWKPWSTGG